MASKRQFSFRWRLFIPIALTMWVVIGAFTWYTYVHETRYRERTINSQLTRIGTKVLQAYDNNIDLTPFMNFVRYYNGSTLYSELRVSVYDRSGNLIYSIGKPTISDYTKIGDIDQLITTETGASQSGKTLFGTKYFFMSAMKSNDGQIFVHTLLPYSERVMHRLQLGSDFWLLVAAAFLVATLIVYFTAGYVTRNVKLLREFADKAASVTNPGSEEDDSDIFDESKFPHDELGDISRRLIELYHDRTERSETCGGRAPHSHQCR